MLFPDIRAVSGRKFFFVFQQTVPHDIAPKTADAVALLDQETPDCIPPALWPPIALSTLVTIVADFGD